MFNDRFDVITAYPDTSPAFCHIIRSVPELLDTCLQCDRKAIHTVHQTKKSYIYQCHAGLTESITPIFLGNIVIGYLYIGAAAAFDSYEEGWETILNLCASYPVDFAKLKQAFWSKTLVNKKQLISAAHIMNAVSSYLCLERMAYLKNEDLIIQIDNYVTENLSSDITIEKICQEFQIGKTYLYNLSIQNYGTGMASHIRNLRIAKAKVLLAENLDLTIRDISDICGFTDYNYFIALFKRSTGYSPRKYRIAHNHK